MQIFPIADPPRRRASPLRASREVYHTLSEIPRDGPFLFDPDSLKSFFVMALPPKKPQTGRAVPGKPGTKPGAPTRRGSTAPPSGRAPAPSAPQKNNLPLILGLAGGGVAIVIIAFVALSGSEEPRSEKNARSKEPKA